jgi:hypothetical protein
MKNLNNILVRSNMTPLERVSALVHNNAHKEKTGKDILSESQLHTLTHGWTAQIGQINEYNRYIGIVQLEHSMRIDAQMFSYHAELSLVRNERILTYCLTDLKKMNGVHTIDLMQGITKEESISFALAHTYLEYGHVLHTFTFFNLPLEIREDLVLLDDSLGYNKQYLEDEVLLYEMLKSGKFSKKDKDTLVDNIFSRMYYEGIKKMRDGTEKDGFMIGDFFAELPLKEVMHKVAHNVGIKYKNRNDEEVLKDIETYATDKEVTMEYLTRETLHTWLDNGLFTKEFTPIFASDRFDTWNGNTKKSHKELFMIWYAELQKSRKYFASLFSARKLKRQEVEMTILFQTKVVEMITGESLYACEEDLEFVREYKRQVEMILPFSNFALFIEKYAKPVQNYKTLCQFRKLGNKASDMFDANFTEKYEELIESYKDEVELLNHELVKLTDMATERLRGNSKEDFRYGIHIVDGKFWFDLEADADMNNIAQKYVEEFKKVGVNIGY